MRGYRRAWLGRDVIAGLTLAAVAIPESMGYASIARTPVQNGLYTLLLPTLAFVLLGASSLMVVGADSATASILAAGLLGLGLDGLTPGSPRWVALCGLVALVTGVLLALARAARLGFLGDFLSTAALIGFLAGVGVQVATGQLPAVLGVPAGRGSWFQQQWAWLSHLGDVSVPTLAYAVATVAIIVAARRWAPAVPGAVVAVVLLIAVSAATHAEDHGVSVVGDVPAGLPALGLPAGVEWSDVPKVFAIAFACFVMVIAQSSATARSFALRHGQRADVDRDLVGLSVANLVAGLSSAFVVNGSPTKTQVLDGQRARSQLANLTMVVAVLAVLVFLTGLLHDMPHAVLGAIVLVVGLELVDVRGLRDLAARRRSELVIAVVTAVVVVAVGVLQGIIVAVFVSLVEVVRRLYRPRGFVVVEPPDGQPAYHVATPGTESEPGLIVFRYDAELFYANAHHFVDLVEQLVTSAPHAVRWFVLDASTLDDVDYTASGALTGLLDAFDARGVTFVLARADPGLVATLDRYGVTARVRHTYGNLTDAIEAFRATAPAPPTGPSAPAPPAPPTMPDVPETSRTSTGPTDPETPGGAPGNAGSPSSPM